MAQPFHCPTSPPSVRPMAGPILAPHACVPRSPPCPRPTPAPPPHPLMLPAPTPSPHPHTRRAREGLRRAWRHPPCRGPHHDQRGAGADRARRHQHRRPSDPGGLALPLHREQPEPDVRSRRLLRQAAQRARRRLGALRAGRVEDHHARGHWRQEGGHFGQSAGGRRRVSGAPRRGHGSRDLARLPARTE